MSRRSSRVKIERHEGSRNSEPGKNGWVVFGVKVPRPKGSEKTYICLELVRRRRACAVRVPIRVMHEI